jgi:predicted nucleic acid-binding protein
MIRQKIYIESTVWYQMVNYAGSEFKETARQLFELVDQERYEVFISDIVLEEIACNSGKYRKKLEQLIGKYKPKVLLQNASSDDIAQAYAENAFLKRDRAEIIVDACHAAIATIANISYMASYSYRTLLNVQNLAHFNAVNILAGYGHSLTALPPFMFLDLSSYSGEKGEVVDKVWSIKKECGKKLLDIMSYDEKKRKTERDTRARKRAKKLGLDLVQISRTTSYVQL